MCERGSTTAITSITQRAWFDTLAIAADTFDTAQPLDTRPLLGPGRPAHGTPIDRSNELDIDGHRSLPINLIYPDVVLVHKDPDDLKRIVLFVELILAVLEVRGIAVDAASRARIRAEPALPTLERWAIAAREITQISQLFELG
jgi:hypothetical protein